MSDFDFSPYVVGGGARAGAIDGLDADFRGRLAEMFSAAPPDVRAGLKIKSAYRSPERQAEILASSLAARVGPGAAARWQAYVDEAGGDVVKAGQAARPWLRETGITKWVAPPGSSNHQRRVAADLDYASPAVTSWAHANAGRFGLAFPLGNEDWHVEPVGARSAPQGAVDVARASPPGAPAATAAPPAGAPGASGLPNDGVRAPALADLMTANAEADGAVRQAQQSLLGDLLLQTDQATKQKKARAAEEEQARRMALFGDVLGVRV